MQTEENLLTPWWLQSIGSYFFLFPYYYLTDWCDSVGENPDFEDLPVHDLASLLRRFYGGAKKQDGTSYSLQSLRGLRAAIHWHITSPPYSRKINILRDREFMSANNVFQAVMKRLKRDGNDKSCHKSAIRAADITKMFSSGALSTSNTVSLSEANVVLHRILLL